MPSLMICLHYFIICLQISCANIYNRPLRATFSSCLKYGILPIPRYIYPNATQFYHTSTLKENNGKKVDGVDEVNVWANRNGLLWISGKKILGADYGAAVAVPVTNLAQNPLVIEGKHYPLALVLVTLRLLKL